MSLLFKIITLCLVFANFSNASIQDSFKNRVYVHQNRNLLTTQLEENCTPAAIHEFPSDGLTREQRRAGWIAIHILLTCYCFIILSIVCDDYFVPAIQTLVKRLELSEDVAGASFMAITSASPELFINCVGTFITEGDIGVGTVVGSNVFNILAAPACCGLFARMAFQFEWWSIIRDGLMYAISVILLIVTLHDDKVHWYEALVFVLAYAVYIGAMYYNKPIRKKLLGCCGQSKHIPINHELDKLNQAQENPHLPHVTDNNLQILVTEIKQTETTKNDADDKTSGQISNIWEFPTKEPAHKKAWWILIWPILFSLTYTTPNCKRHPHLFLFTLLMCMFWIGSTSYLLAWLITAIGDTISIPDSVMGLSFLAVGSSMPEIVSCIIVSKQGQGIMGMSSALGANTFEILLCLGLPWLIKTCFYPKVEGSHWININSSGLAYNATCLLSTLIFLYICLICNQFRLDWKVGLICLMMYGVFLVVGTLIELNFFFVVNLPTCT